MTPDEPGQPVLSPPMLKAVLATRDLTVAKFAQRLQISEGYLWRIISGQNRPAQQLWDRIRAELGPSGWDFATGTTNILTVEARA